MLRVVSREMICQMRPLSFVLAALPPAFQRGSLHQAIRPADDEDAPEQTLAEQRSGNVFPEKNNRLPEKQKQPSSLLRHVGRRILHSDDGRNLELSAHAKASASTGPSANSALKPIALPMVAAMLD